MVKLYKTSLANQSNGLTRKRAISVHVKQVTTDIVEFSYTPVGYRRKITRQLGIGEFATALNRNPKFGQMSTF